MALTMWLILKDAFCATLIAMTFADLKKCGETNWYRVVFICLMLIL